MKTATVNATQKLLPIHFLLGDNLTNTIAFQGFPCSDLLTSLTRRSIGTVKTETTTHRVRSHSWSHGSTRAPHTWATHGWGSSGRHHSWARSHSGSIHHAWWTNRPWSSTWRTTTTWWWTTRAPIPVHSRAHSTWRPLVRINNLSSMTSMTVYHYHVMWFKLQNLYIKSISMKAIKQLFLTVLFIESYSDDITKTKFVK